MNGIIDKLLDSGVIKGEIMACDATFIEAYSSARCLMALDLGLRFSWKRFFFTNATVSVMRAMSTNRIVANGNSGITSLISQASALPAP